MPEAAPLLCIVVQAGQAPRPPKLAFDVKDVAATREALMARGAKMGKISSKNGLDLCNGKDPDGNPFGLSNRVQ
jgi:hypothetical protein